MYGIAFVSESANIKTECVRATLNGWYSSVSSSVWTLLAHGRTHNKRNLSVSQNQVRTIQGAFLAELLCCVCSNETKRPEMRPPNFFVALSAFNPSKYSGRVANHSHVKIKSLFVPSLAAAMMYLFTPCPTSSQILSRHGSGSALSATGNRLGRTPAPPIAVTPTVYDHLPAEWLSVPCK